MAYITVAEIDRAALKRYQEISTRFSDLDFGQLRGVAGCSDQGVDCRLRYFDKFRPVCGGV